MVKKIKNNLMEKSCSSIFADIYLCMYEEHTAANDEIKSLRYVDDILLVGSNAIEIIYLNIIQIV